MSNSKKDNRRKTTPSYKYGERRYFLVQFIEDNVKIIVDETELRKEDDNTTTAMYVDKKFYPCVVLSESDDKEHLSKTKNAMDAMAKKRGGSSKKENKQTGGKKKAKSPTKQVCVSSKVRSEKEKQETAKEKEESRKKEKMQKKKALDERDLNLLGRLSQLNQSVIVVNERDREAEERELKRKKCDLDRREKELERREGHVHSEANRKNEIREEDSSELALLPLRIEEVQDEDCEEDSEFSDSGLGCSMDDIDVLEATNIIRTSTPETLQRPTIGEKRPRARPTPVAGSTAKKCPRRQIVPECTQCRHLLAENKELKETNALLTEQLNAQRQDPLQEQPSEAPRPGKISKEVAERYQMIELSPGKSVYMYESHLTKAYAKKTATATACFLLGCFYSEDELVGRSLGGKNGKQAVDTDILDSILSFTRKKFPNITSDSAVKISLRNKITCIEVKLRKRNVHVVS